MHWAAIGGNLEACTVLVQAGTKEDLMVADKSGCTPEQLASNKANRRVTLLLVSICRPGLRNMVHQEIQDAIALMLGFISFVLHCLGCRQMQKGFLEIVEMRKAFWGG